MIELVGMRAFTPTSKARRFGGSALHVEVGRLSLHVQRRFGAGFVFLALAALCNSGCDVLDVSRNDVAGRIDHDVTFKLAEGHVLGAATPDVPKLFFTMQTKEIFGCLGYQIRHSVDRVGDAVILHALEIEHPGDVCLGALGPATARFEVSLPSGIYALVLVNGEIRDEYVVTVTDRYVEIKSGEAAWTEPAATLQWRYPHNSFAYYCGTTLDAKSICTEFASRLGDLPLTQIEVPEYGEWPYRLQSQGHYFDATARFYSYPDEATWEAVKDRLRAFTRERIVGQQGVGLTVENWLLDAVSSWLVDKS